MCIRDRCLPGAYLGKLSISTRKLKTKRPWDSAGDLADRMPDPLMNRTSGAIVIANTERGDAFQRLNATHATSQRAAEQHTISVFTHTMLAEEQASAFDFLKQTMLRAKAAAPPAEALDNHTRWWSSFWNRWQPAFLPHFPHQQRSFANTGSVLTQGKLKTSVSHTDRGWSCQRPAQRTRQKRRPQPMRSARHTL